MRYPALLWPAVAVAAFLSLSPVSAGEAQVAPLLVTASRTAQTADDTLSSVSVITRADIERVQATTVPELLGQVQGVEFVQNGGRGKASSLFIRGTNSDQIIVLVDGVRVGSATLGTTSFESLPLANIERIEVVRGPRSSLYGSDAIGGVIQIFTRRGDAPHAGIDAGSHGFGRISAGYADNTADGSLSIDFSAEDTEGFDARENDCAACADEPDDDGFKSANLSLRGHRELSPAIKLSGSLLLADSENEFDGNFQNSGEQLQSVASIKLDWLVNDLWQTHLSVGRSSDETENFLNGTEVSDFGTERIDLGWQNDVTLSDAQVVTAGIDVLHDEIDSDSTEFAVTERRTVGVYIQHQWAGQRWNTQASARQEFFDDGFDDPKPGGGDFGDETTGSIAAGYRLQETLRVFGSFGTAFRAPTFNQLFFPDFGNPDLEPEQSQSVELGVRGRAGIATWEITAYRTEVDDLIVFESTGAGFRPVNTAEAEIRGIEVGVHAAWDDWQASLNADIKDPEDKATGNQLARRAKHNVRASVTRTIGRWSVGADLAVQGERFDENENNTRLDDYPLIDLRATWRFATDWRASFKINNAGNTDYALADTFNTDDRNFVVQVSWRPGSSS